MCYRLKSGRQLYIKKKNDSDTNIRVNNHLLVISLYMSLSSIVPYLLDSENVWLTKNQLKCSLIMHGIS